MQKGDIAGWLNSLPPQTDEYKALSQAHLHFLELANKTPNFQPVPTGCRLKPEAATHGSPRLLQR